MEKILLVIIILIIIFLLSFIIVYILINKRKFVNLLEEYDEYFKIMKSTNQIKENEIRKEFANERNVIDALYIKLENKGQELNEIIDNSLLNIEDFFNDKLKEYNELKIDKNLILNDYELSEKLDTLNNKIENINIMINSNFMRLNLIDNEFKAIKEFYNKVLNEGFLKKINNEFKLNENKFLELSKLEEEQINVNRILCSFKTTIDSYKKILEVHSKEILEIKSIIDEIELNKNVFSENEMKEKNVSHDDTFEKIVELFNPNNENKDILPKCEKVENTLVNVGIKSDVQYSDLNEEKREIIKQIESTNNNYFITGKAGTGKSFLLNYFKNNTKKKAIYLAPTGIAAININGVTIHSAFGYQNIVGTASKIRISTNQEELFKTVSTIVIDEISMVRCDCLERIDYILKKINKNNTPFGGKQMIIIGDIFQLPPIAKKEEIDYLNNTYGGIFFFNSNSFKDGDFHCVELQEVFRQRDQKFINLLNDVRYGNITPEIITVLNSRYKKEIKNDIIQIVPKKNTADAINKFKLSKIENQEFVYYAKYDKDNKSINENDYPFAFELHLKVGATVLMIHNDPQKRWVNGTFGKVSFLSENIIKVIIDEIEYQVNPIPIGKKRCIYNRDINQIEYTIENIVIQYPMLIGYAITIHKSQGSTYTQMACDLNECFVHGQAYVALSRCTNFTNLYLTSLIEDNPFLINYELIEFYNKTFKKV